MPQTEPRADKIILRGLIFYGYHGVNTEEQKLGQRFRVDVTLLAELSAAAESDDIADTISYAWAYKQVRAVMEGPPSKLLEHLAGRIGAALLADSRALRVQVRILKLGAPISGMAIGEAGVEMNFDREPERALTT